MSDLLVFALPTLVGALLGLVGGLALVWWSHRPP